jgi:uracil phosphoribosyltransferase
MTVILNEHASAANGFLHTLRDRTLQRDRERFRTALRRLGALMAYEISKQLAYHPLEVPTALGMAYVALPRQQPVLVSVMRAGLSYYQGFQEVFPHADAGFIGAYRKSGTPEVEINLDYAGLPVVDGRTVILIDPMLATGKSFVESVRTLHQHGTPAHLHLAALLAAPEGIAYIEQHIKVPYTVWTWALDERLNNHAYIVPGLGDAGDLCFGEKI